MKRLDGLWTRVTAFENLLRAWRKARLGKRTRPSVSRFALNLEGELLDLQRALREGTYRPGAYRLFTIYERKPRTIAAAPFRDRVVHHALMRVIEPPLDRRFIHDSYACRAGKGVHAAVTRYQGWARRYAYVLKMDVARYFPSIDHAILKEKVRRHVRDRDVLALVDVIVDTSPPQAPVLAYFPGDDLLTPLARRAGIPIGNLTSQFFANLYLDGLDHAMRARFGAAAYLRYVDDMVVLDDDKGRLRELREAVREHLEGERLRLHPRKAHVSPVRAGLDLLGYRVWPHRRRLRNDNGHRFARRLRGYAAAYARGDMDWSDIHPRVRSWVGHAMQADTEGLRRRILSGTVFTRGAGHETASAGSAAAPGTTNRGTCARPTATGTTPTTGTTTSVSVLCSPPASPEPARSRMRRARHAGVHEPASRPRMDGSDE